MLFKYRMHLKVFKHFTTLLTR